MLVQIIGGVPYVVGAHDSFQSRMRHMQQQLMDLVSEYDVPDVDFIVNVVDYCRPWASEVRSKDGNQSRCTKNVSVPVVQSYVK